MDTAIMKSLLGDYLDEVNLTSEQLAKALSFLFNQADTIEFTNDHEIIDALRYLKEIAEENCFTQLGELVAHFQDKRSKYGKFLWEVMDKSSSSEDHHNHYLSRMDDKLILKHVSSSSDKILYPDLYSNDIRQFIKILSVYFKNVVGSVRNQLSLHQEVRINLDMTDYPGVAPVHSPVYFGSGSNLCRYFEKFASTDNKREVFGWKAVRSPHQYSDGQNFWVVPDGTSQWACRVEMSRKFLVDRSLNYDHIVSHIEQEIPISDESIREEMVEWLFYSKLHSAEINSLRNVVCELGDTGVPIKTTKKDRDIKRKKLIADQISVYRAILAAKKWRILKSPPGHVWLTSDNPGFGINLSDLYNRPTKMVADSSLREIRPDTLIYYPLSSDYCLRIQPLTGDKQSSSMPIDSTIEFEQSTVEELEIVNGLTFSTKNEMVIAKDKKALNQLEMI